MVRAVTKILPTIEHTKLLGYELNGFLHADFITLVNIVNLEDLVALFHRSNQPGQLGSLWPVQGHKVG